MILRTKTIQGEFVEAFNCDGDRADAEGQPEPWPVEAWRNSHRENDRIPAKNEHSRILRLGPKP
jgi:hypothetical protein